MQTAVTSLSLHHFRNYTQARLEPGARSVILAGHNGAGKTNVLEALSFLIPGRGLRRAKLSQVDNSAHPGTPWAVAASAVTPHGEAQLGTGRDASVDTDKRSVRINGAPARSVAALAEYLSIAWLTPREDGLFVEGNSARRRFLDRLVYGFDPTHAERVNAYEHAMRERNRLLALPRADEHWLTTLERRMAEAAAAIGHARLEAVQHVNHVMQASPLSFPKASLHASGAAEDALVQGETALNVENQLAERWARERRVDAAAGRTLSGTHRSELGVMHLAKNMEAEHCSTGEQKALLLSILLAEARAGARWHGRVPVLLLDEVAAHLDASRRAELFEELQDIGAQTWMTGTDLSLFENMRQDCAVYEVSNGEITPL